MTRAADPRVAAAVVLVLCLVLVVLAYAAGVEVGRADGCGPSAQRQTFCPYPAGAETASSDTMCLNMASHR